MDFDSKMRTMITATIMIIIIAAFMINSLLNTVFSILQDFLLHQL
jgi:hypothetical protein